MDSKEHVLLYIHYEPNNLNHFHGTEVLDKREWESIKETMRRYFDAGNIVSFMVTPGVECTLKSYDEWIRCFSSQSVTPAQDYTLTCLGLQQVGNTTVLDVAYDIVENYDLWEQDVTIPDASVLVQTTCNWADEIDFYGHIVVTQKEYEETVKRTKAYFNKGNSFTFYVGSNEDIEITTYDEWERCIDASAITSIQYKSLRELGLLTGGSNRVWTDLWEVLYDNNEG